MTGTAVAIGSFDGVHLGHQGVLRQLRQQAAALGLEPVVVTFDPLPREYFLGAQAPARLQSLRDRVDALRATGVERVCRLRFDAALAAVRATDFVEQVLVERLAARAVVVGADFRFGHGRQGDPALLASMGLAVATTETVLVGGERVSSTRIRAALAEADFTMASTLLGRPWTVSGRVRRGDRRGRQIGFPTANLVPHRPLPIPEGVYAVRVDGRLGAAHWGRRAGLGGTERRLEVHLLDYQGDLYGQRLQVRFERFIRPDHEFTDLASLQVQIESDIRAVRDTMAADG